MCWGPLGQHPLMESLLKQERQNVIAGIVPLDKIRNGEENNPTKKKKISWEIMAEKNRKTIRKDSCPKQPKQTQDRSHMFN